VVTLGENIARTKVRPKEFNPFYVILVPDLT
jgi:hypothetical protein